MCAVRVVSLRELEARDEAVATRHDQSDGLHNTMDMLTCVYYHFLLKYHQELNGGTGQRDKIICTK